MKNDERTAVNNSDTTESRRAEEASRDSEEKLRLIFASMADGVVVTDMNGTITEINDAQLRMFRYKEKSEIIGKAGLDFLAERERGRAVADMSRIPETGVNSGSLYIAVDRNGREFECEISTAFLHDTAGKPNGIVNVMRDITERRKAEEALQASEDRFRTLIENATDAIVIVDANGKIIYESNSMERITGYRVGDWVDTPIGDWIIHPDDLTKLASTLMEVIKNPGGILEGVTARD